MTGPTIDTAATRRRNRGWVWYLVMLIGLSILFVGVLHWYNQAQQLRPDKLAAAQALWTRNAPKNYDLRFTVSGSTSNVYAVRVRNGEVASVSCNDAELPREQHIHHTMNAIFAQIEAFLDQDAKPNRPATFTIAVFDPDNGHVRRFIRRVKGSAERIEIQAKLTVVN